MTSFFRIPSPPISVYFIALVPVPVGDGVLHGPLPDGLKVSACVLSTEIRRNAIESRTREAAHREDADVSLAHDAEPYNLNTLVWHFAVSIAHKGGGKGSGHKRIDQA